MPASVSVVRMAADDAGRSRLSDMRYDRTHSLDHATAVARQHKSNRQRRRSATTIEMSVSLLYIAVKELL